MSLKPTFRKPTEVKKGWGKEVIIANNEKYCGKLLCFNKGEKFSMHYHLLKTESFYILKGMIYFQYYDLTKAEIKEESFSDGDIIDIPVGCPHKIEAIEDTIIIEVSTQHFDFDSYRVIPGSSQKNVGS